MPGKTVSRSDFVKKLPQVSDLDQLVAEFEKLDYDWYRADGSLREERSIGDKKVLAYKEAKNMWWDENRVYDSYQQVREPVSTHINLDGTDLYVHGFVSDSMDHPVSEDVKDFLLGWIDNYLRHAEEIYAEDSIADMATKEQRKNKNFKRLNDNRMLKDYCLFDYYISKLQKTTKMPGKRALMRKYGNMKNNFLFDFTNEIAKNKSDSGMEKDLYGAIGNARKDKDWHKDLQNAIRSYTLPLDIEKDYDSFMDNEKYILRDKRSEFLAEELLKSDYDSETVHMIVDFEHEPLVLDYINKVK